ncbi:MAG: hypothetical protein SF051_05135 [Elusimicrobiota bacterium]|nr:hypothetical protein [Elusimicrobiota bacterium]
MSPRAPLLLLCLAACAAAQTAPTPREIRLTPEQALSVGRRIFQNEAGGKVELLTHWNQHEDFPSLGIGHFLWYVPGRPGRFTETFPGLLDHLAAEGVALPAWLAVTPRPGCPWNDRASFYAEFDGPRLTELRRLLADTIPQQARFIAGRLEAALPKVLAAAPAAERARLEERFYRVAAAPNGVYALVDFVNFKGEGINPAERYNGEGWGLLQALELMADAGPGQPSVEAFAAGCDAALTRRVANAPADRRAAEQGWLPGWRRRLATYREP